MAEAALEDNTGLPTPKMERVSDLSRKARMTGSRLGKQRMGAGTDNWNRGNYSEKAYLRKGRDRGKEIVQGGSSARRVGVLFSDRIWKAINQQNGKGCRSY